MTIINEFRGKYAFLSNFYTVTIFFEEDTYLSVENAYQAAKLDDRSRRWPFLYCSASVAKSLGAVMPYKRADWDEIRVGIMEKLIDFKFDHPEMGKLLLETGNAELVEGNYWGDIFWGVCRGQGENHLGRLLMEKRSQLMREVHVNVAASI